MSHALPSSVPATSPPSGPETPSAAAPNRALRRWLARELAQLRPAIAASAAACDAERYRKHFDAYAHACLLLFHGLSGGPSLRQSYATFADCPQWAALSGLATGREGEVAVSFSHFAASNTSRPPAFLAGLLPALVARVRRCGRASPAAVPPDVRILDGTFLRVSLRLAPWLGLSARTKRPGVVAQVLYTPALDLPEHVVVTDAHTPDVRGLDQAVLDDPTRLAALRDRTLIMDLGYYSHPRLARLLDAGVHVVTRLHPQAALHVEEDLPVQHPLPGLAPADGAGGRIVVHHDQRVTVGSPHNHNSTVVAGLRLVTATVAPTRDAARHGAQPVVYRILTDRHDLDAAEVVQLYLWRWPIEHRQPHDPHTHAYRCVA
jgi:DDE family transposase